jgi:hypothetical protein
MTFAAFGLGAAIMGSVRGTLGRSARSLLFVSFQPLLAVLPPELLASS